MPSTSLHDTSHFPFLEVVDLINTHNVKVESYVSLGGNFRTSSPGGSTSSEPKRSVPRRQSEEPGYTEVLQQTPVNLNIKKSLLVKESQISQVKEFSNFLCMRRRKSLGSLKSLLSHAPQQSGASILCFHILNLLGVHSREWLQSDGCQVAGILLLCECPQGWWTPTGVLQSLITVTSLFTNLPELSHVKPLQSRLILCPLMDYSPPGSSVHEISQARLLKWVPCPPPGDLPNPGIKPVSLAGNTLFLKVNAWNCCYLAKPEIGCLLYFNLIPQEIWSSDSLWKDSVPNENWVR